MATKEPSERGSKLTRISKRGGLLLVLALAAGATVVLPHIFAKGSEAHAAPSGNLVTCGDRYNALLKQAKAALVKGDRNEAIRWLLDARTQLSECQKLEELNSSGVIDVAALSRIPFCS